jgi:glycosyltransferase involved in cell wall biosynthesis
MNRLHVVWITPGFATHEEDDSCIPPLQDLAKAMSDHGVKLTILALDYPFKKEEYDWNGIRVIAFNGRNRGLLSKVLLMKKVLNRLSLLHQFEKIHLVHSFWLSWPAIIGQLFCKRYHLPHVQTLMGQDTRPNRFYRFFDFQYSTLVHLSDYAARIFMKHRTANSTIIPFGIDALHYEDKERDIDLLFVSSFIKLKNPLRFIELVDAIKSQIPSVKAMMIGNFHDSNLVKQCRQLIYSKVLNQNVTISNALSRASVFEHMKRSKVLVHTSHYESQGMVMVEAIAHGCTVFSSGAGIRFSHPKFEVLAVDDAENIMRIVAFLQQDQYVRGEVLLPVNETAQAHYNLYQQLISVKS